MKKLMSIALMFIMIGAALIVGVNTTLGPMREDAEGVYYYDKSGYSISDSMYRRTEVAKNLLKVAEKYEGANPKLQELISDLKFRVDTSSNAYRLSEIIDANEALDAPAIALAEELKQTNLDEKDQKYPKDLITEMESETSRIGHSSYNDEAEEFNAKLDNFPVSFINKLVDIKPLPYI